MRITGGEEPELYNDIPLKQKLLHNGSWLYIFSFVIAPAGYLIKMLVSRSLSVEDVGIVYSIIGLVTILASYNDLGLTEALQYYLPHYLIDKEYDKAKSLLIFTRVSQFLSGIVICIILFFLAPRLALHYFHSSGASIILRYFCFYFLIINLFQVLQSTFIATQKVKLYNAIDFVRLRTIVALTFIAVSTDSLTIIHFSIFWLIGVLIGTIFGLVFFRENMGWLIKNYTYKTDKVLMKQQRSYAFWVLLGTNVGNILGQIDQQFVLYFLGAEQAGYWSNYLTMLGAVGIFTTPIISYLFPLLNELHKKGEHEKIKFLNKLLYLGTFIFGLVVGIVGRFRGESLTVFLLGNKFRFSGILFHYIAPFIWLNVLLSISFQHLASMGKIHTRVKILFIGLLINTILGLVFIHWIGIKGLIIGTVLVWCTMYALVLSQGKSSNTLHKSL